MELNLTPEILNSSFWIFFKIGSVAYNIEIQVRARVNTVLNKRGQPTSHQQTRVITSFVLFRQ